MQHSQINHPLTTPSLFNLRIDNTKLICYNKFTKLRNGDKQMKKILYIILVIAFAVVTSAIRIAFFSDSSLWSYTMGAIYMALCGMAHECLLEGGR